MNTDKIKKFIELAKYSEALDLLKEDAKGTPYEIDVVGLTSRLNALGLDMFNGRIFQEEYNIERNRIVNSILQYNSLLSKVIEDLQSVDVSKSPSVIGNILFKAETFLIEEATKYAFVALYLQLVNSTKETIFLQNFLLDIHFDNGEKETLTWWRTDNESYPDDLPLTSENKGQVLIPFKTRLIEPVLKPEIPPSQGWLPFKGNPNMLIEDRGFKNKPIKLELICIDAFHRRYKIMDDKLDFRMTLTQGGQILFLNYGY